MSPMLQTSLISGSTCEPRPRPPSCGVVFAAEPSSVVLAATLSAHELAAFRVHATAGLDEDGRGRAGLRLGGGPRSLAGQDCGSWLPVLAGARVIQEADGQHRAGVLAGASAGCAGPRRRVRCRPARRWGSGPVRCVARTLGGGFDGPVRHLRRLGRPAPATALRSLAARPGARHLRTVLRSSPRLSAISLLLLPTYQCARISVTSTTSNVLLAIGHPSR